MANLVSRVEMIVVTCPTHGDAEAFRGDMDTRLWCIRCLEDFDRSLMGLLCYHCVEPIGDDFYMVHDEVWARAGLPEYMCQVHHYCLAERLGRPLQREDFTDAPINRDALSGERNVLLSL